MRYLRAALLPMIAGVVIVTAWQAWVTIADVEGFLLPAPSSIFSAFGDNFETVREAALTTFRAALVGLVLGGLSGFVMALLTVRFRRLGDGLTPLAIVAASTPIVVLAPVANIWFGITTSVAKIVVVAIVTFFPVFVNASRGLDSVPMTDLELMHSYGASRVTTLVRVRIPCSVPMLFVGLKIAASLAMITTIVAEYFGGSRRTLGVYITQAASVVKFDVAWAGIVAACFLALLLYGFVQLLERLVAPWYTRSSQT
ncbi:MAG: ABC transporter permease [Actinomycetota bacterium]|nr:ABC transporter permease [Actinomycetota bacterium]